MALKTVQQLQQDLSSGATTAEQLATHYLSRCEVLNPELNALISITPREHVLTAAKASDERRKSGQISSPLDGIPIILKDNICTLGQATTCASKMLQNFVPPYDATVTQKLKTAGLVVLGKANLDEFAMGSSTEFSAFGPSKNPWNTNCVPGGSSGGSAVAVAAGMAPLSLGSDTGGSIRQPAGFCGLVGLKPTYGTVSRYGLVAFASSLDQIGPFGLTVADCALAFDAIAGHDPLDSTSSTVKLPSMAKTVSQGTLKGLKIGRPKQFFDVGGLDAEVKAACDQSLQRLANEGAEIVDVSMPYASDYCVSTYYVLATAEASSNLARYDGAHYGYRAPGTANIVEMFSKTRAQGFGTEVKRRIMLGTFGLSAETFDAYYIRAQKARTLIKRDYDNALAQCDVILSPTSPTTAFPFGAKTSDPLQMYLADIFTLSLNLAGYCGLSLPVGFDEKGLPIGLQVMAGAFEEEKLLQASYAMEAAFGLANSRTAPAALKNA